MESSTTRRDVSSLQNSNKNCSDDDSDAVAEAESCSHLEDAKSAAYAHMQASLASAQRHPLSSPYCSSSSSSSFSAGGSSGGESPQRGVESGLPRNEHATQLHDEEPRDESSIEDKGARFEERARAEEMVHRILSPPPSPIGYSEPSVTLPPSKARKRHEVRQVSQSDARGDTLPASLLSTMTLPNEFTALPQEREGCDGSTTTTAVNTTFLVPLAPPPLLPGSSSSYPSQHQQQPQSCSDRAAACEEQSATRTQTSTTPEAVSQSNTAPTPSSPSLRSPTPLDLTAAPKHRLATWRLGRPSDEGETARGGVVARGTNAETAESASCTTSLQRGTSNSAVSPSVDRMHSAEPSTRTTARHPHESKSHDADGAEVDAQGGRRLSFSGSTADLLSRSHSTKEPAAHDKPALVNVRASETLSEYQPPRTDSFAGAAQKVGAAATQSSDTQLPASNCPAPAHRHHQQQQQQQHYHHSARRDMSPLPHHPADAAATQQQEGTSSAQLYSTTTATPCSSSSPTPEPTPRGHAFVRELSPGGSRDGSPAPRAVSAAAKGFAADATEPFVSPARQTWTQDADGYALPVLPSRYALNQQQRQQQRTPNTSVPLAAPHPSQQHLRVSGSPMLERLVPDFTAGEGASSENRVASSPARSGVPPLPSLPHLPSVLYAERPSQEPSCPCVPRIVPTHDSVFFPLGTEVVAPVLLHYATVGGWSTTAGGRDYFSHRRLRGGEVAGHSVRWLHTAQPRDRFVFLVTPVLDCDALRAQEEQDELAAYAQAGEGKKGHPNCSPVKSATSPSRQQQQRSRVRGWRQKPRTAAQRLRRFVFGEGPWFTQGREACGPRSRIVCDDVSHLSSDGDTAEWDSYEQESTPQQLLPLVSDVSPDACGSDEEGVMEVLRTPRGSVREMSAPAGAQPFSRSVGPPCCSMSPKLVTRQVSQNSASTYLTPVSAPTQLNDSTSSLLTPLSLGLSVPPIARNSGSGVYESSTSAVATACARRSPPLQATASLPRSGHAGAPLATPATLSGPPFPLNSGASILADVHSPPRRSVTPSEPFLRTGSGSRRYVFSPVTGTAESASGAAASTTTGRTTPRCAPRVWPVKPMNVSPLQSAMTPAPQQSTGTSAATPATTAAAAAAGGGGGSAASPAVGVEVIEIAHADVTAMDYAPRLTSHRLSIEAQEVYTYFFSSLTDALAYYQCTEAMALMEEQWEAGMTSQIPRPQRDPTLARKQQQQQQQQKQQRMSSSYRSSSSVRTPSLHTRGTPPTVEQSDSAFLGGAAVFPTSPQTSVRNVSFPSETSTLSSALRGAAAAGCPPTTYHHVEESCSSLAPTRLFRPHSASAFHMDGGRGGEKYRHSSSNYTAGQNCPTAKGASVLSPTTQDRPSTPAASMTSVKRAAAATAAAAADGAFRTPPQLLNHHSHHRTYPAAFPRSASVPNMDLTPTLTSPAHTPQSHEPVVRKLTSSHHEIVVSVYTTDPVFNSILRELLMPEPGTHPYTVSVADQKRLLSMVEVGMPAWAVFYSSTGLPYRRLFRLLYSGMTNLWPLLSLAVGVYDLYKHLPQLKRFMERTFDPLTRWLERRFRLRFSVLATYLFSVVVTIFSSLSAFVSQFYVVQLLSLPIVQLIFALIKLPFLLAFDTIWLFTSTIFSTVGLVWQLIRVLVMAPVVFVVNVASLRETFGVVAPVAVQGTSMSVKWWKTWSEFWETVASPMKNAVRAWWDSMLHVSTSAARRETSIRRWYSPKAEQSSRVLGELQDVVAINAQLWWTEFIHPGFRRWVVLVVALVYLYWLFLGISAKVWDDFIYASGVRHPSSPGVIVEDVGRGLGSSKSAGSGGGGEGGSSNQRGERRDGSASDFVAEHANGTSQPPTAAVVNNSAVTVDELAVTPAAALMHLLFQSSFNTFNAVLTRAVASTTPLNTSTSAPSSFSSSSTSVRSEQPQPSCSSAALLFTPTSVIQMCDRAGTSTIITTTTRTANLTAATPTVTTVVTTTVLPLPTASLPALLAELLLPNVVLQVMHQLHRVVTGGWATAAQVAARKRQLWQLARARAKPTEAVTYGNSSEENCCCLNSSTEQCEGRAKKEGSGGVDAFTGAPFTGKREGADGVCESHEGPLHASTHALVPHINSLSDLMRVLIKSKSRPYRMRTYAEERLALVKSSHGRLHSSADIPQFVLSWDEVNYLKYGATQGQQTPREHAVVEDDTSSVNSPSE